MIEREIKSFEELAKIADDYSKERWIFRGVEKDCFQLIPKVGRPEFRKRQLANDTRPLTKKEEADLLRTFSVRARPFINYDVKRKIDWMSIGQHHGLPTRLLDWTESLFVAAYFATNNTIEGTRATIYAINDIKVRPGDDPDPFAGGKEVMAFYPTPFSPRITAQRSVFTIHPNPTEKFDVPHLQKIVFAGDEPKHRELAFRVKLTLDSLGFNSATMMADLDGLANHLGWAFKRERLPAGAKISRNPI